MFTNETAESVLQLPNDILESVASSCNQVEVDYFIHCICNNKKDLAYDGITAAGFSADDADAFIDEVEKLHNDDLARIEIIRQALQLSDEALVELAQTIIRVLM